MCCSGDDSCFHRSQGVNRTGHYGQILIENIPEFYPSNWERMGLSVGTIPFWVDSI